MSYIHAHMHMYIYITELTLRCQLNCSTLFKRCEQAKESKNKKIKSK